MNFALAQEEASGQNGNQSLSRSPSRSFFAQLSTSPYGWSSRSTSPTPPLFTGSLRHVQSASNRFLPQGQSLQALAKLFINKVSRGTQTDCDDNFDQLSIASLATGYSQIENQLSRSRLKLFLNDQVENKKEYDENEFVEELQKLRDQIDDQFKYGFSSQANSREISQCPTPKEYADDGMISLDIDRNLADFGNISATRTQATETEPMLTEDKTTQVDLINANQVPSKSAPSSIMSNLLPFFYSDAPTDHSFSVSTQTDNECLCNGCWNKMQQINGNDHIEPDSNIPNHPVVSFKYH